MNKKCSKRICVYELFYFPIVWHSRLIINTFSELKNLRKGTTKHKSRIGLIRHRVPFSAVDELPCVVATYGECPARQQAGNDLTTWLSPIHNALTVHFVLMLVYLHVCRHASPLLTCTYFCLVCVTSAWVKIYTQDTDTEKTTSYLWLKFSDIC